MGALYRQESNLAGAIHTPQLASLSYQKTSRFDTYLDYQK